MKYEVNRELLYSSSGKNRVSKHNAEKLANNVVREYKPYLPLTWESLTEVELIGELDSIVEARLHFDSGGVAVVITRISVSDDMGILQSGSRSGVLEY